jgi:aspartyl-tRNA(Asn)/glutamyl-tRNA(Gln) amidotransferase subunit B
MKTYTPTIGIEVHAELKTKTKMFCGSKNDPHGGAPNTHVCPVCLAHPGTLPTINKEAVKHVIKVGLALGASIATFTEFDRKNYFYPDIPKGYQISQYKYPLVSGGELAGVAITRVHLEEDTARSQHDKGAGSLIDYNRAGVPLMELVTEPVIHDAKTAVQFAKELQLLLRTLGVSDANMERGEMRVEANISIQETSTQEAKLETGVSSQTTEKFGTKVEVKNLNSFKAVEQSIIYEVRRQEEILESGSKVKQETRGWDENKNKTFSQRSKETSQEYRYFPDPDVPKLDLALVTDLSLSRIRSEMPKVPSEKVIEYENLGLPREQIDVIISDPNYSSFFDEVLAQSHDVAFVRLSGNYFTSDMQSVLASVSKTIELASASHFAALIALVVEGAITSRVAKDLLPEIIFGGKMPRELAEERGLIQDNSEDSLVETVRAVIAGHTQVVADYKGGKDASLQFLIGQAMKMTKGSANPTLLKELFVREMS